MSHKDLNIEAYEVMAEMLVTVRRIVHRGLEKATGKTWYLDGCPPGVYERLVDRKENEVAIDRFDRDYQELISFASLDDLAEIIEYNTELAQLLETIAPEGSTVAERLREIESLRLKLAATVPLDDEDVEKLLSFHADFRESLTRKKKPATESTGAAHSQSVTSKAVTGDAGGGGVEPVGPEPDVEEEVADFGTRATEIDELSAADVVTESAAEDPATVAAASPAASDAQVVGATSELAIDAERAMAIEDDHEVLRILRREVMSLAEDVVRGRTDSLRPVWRTLRSSGWYDIKKDQLGIEAIERFYEVADEASEKAAAGGDTRAVKAILEAAGFSKLLLSLREMFLKYEL
jgi:hypothetical protein